MILGGGEGVQFCRLVGEKTLLAHTRRRVRLTVRPDRTLFILTKMHEPFYARELAEVPARQMVVQPNNRGTLPAMLWSLMRLDRLDRKAVVAFFPSDHHYAKEKKFLVKVASAFAAAETASSVILLGASATAPEAAYGWIEPDPQSADKKLPKVRRFWEKPTCQVAQELLDQGCLWNTFVMVGRARVFLELIQSTAPGLYEAFQAAFTQSGAEVNPASIEALYEQIERTDFSNRVLSEASENLAVLNLGDVGWNDLGDPRRVRAMLYPARPRSRHASPDRCSKSA